MSRFHIERFEDAKTLHDCIRKVFEGDKELLEKYHILKGSELSVCVKNTYESIVQISEQFPMDYHKVLSDEELIGYLVTSQSIMGAKVLYSFGLNKEYRKEFAKDLFESVQKLLGEQFLCILWEHNSRAINYLKRNGLREVSRNNQTVTLCP